MEIIKEIEIRKALLNVKVGQLYPSIVRSKLVRLNERYAEIYWLVEENVTYFTDGNR